MSLSDNRKTFMDNASDTRERLLDRFREGVARNIKAAEAAGNTALAEEWRAGLAEVEAAAEEN